jgi:phage terminase small subunit
MTRKRTAPTLPSRRLKELKESGRPTKGGQRPGAGMPKGFQTRKTRAKRAAEAKVIAETGLSAARVLEELRRVAFCDAGAFWTARGALKAIHTLKPTARSCLAGFEAVIKNVDPDDGKTDLVHKIKLWDKVKALELLGKHFALFVEKIELKDVTAEARVARLVAARRRVGDV